MASEIRVDTLKTTSGLGTVTFSNNGTVLSGIVTVTTEIRVNTIKTTSGLGTVTFNSSGTSLSGSVTANSFVGNGTIPVGGIIMWSGTVAELSTKPELANWKLCNGSNGTPDLRDRFIVGAGNNYIPGDTGGADSVTLTTNQIPSHTHFTVANDTSPASSSTSNVTSTSAMSKGTGASSLYESYNLVNSGISATLSPTSSTGSGNSHENRPPYYALAFIMRIS